MSRARRTAVLLLVVYIAVGAIVAFWPDPLDRGIMHWIYRIRFVFPWATAPRVEFVANIAFFVPLGWLLSVILERWRYLVLPIGIVTTTFIETVQGELLIERTASVMDIVANTAGTCIGIIIAAAVSARATRRRPPAPTSQ